MPSDSELEATLQQLLVRARAENDTPKSDLPDIDPNLLLSPAARSEMAAIGTPLRGKQFLGMSLDDESFFGLVTGMAEPSAAEVFEIDYDLDLETGAVAPNERARFQIGRESPPRDFMATDRVPQSQDGSVVARVGARGRFENLSRPQPTPRPAPVVAARSEPAAPVAVSKYTLLKTDPFS